MTNEACLNATFDLLYMAHIEGFRPDEGIKPNYQKKKVLSPFP